MTKLNGLFEREIERINRWICKIKLVEDKMKKNGNRAIKKQSSGITLIAVVFIIITLILGFFLSSQTRSKYKYFSNYT